MNHEEMETKFEQFKRELLKDSQKQQQNKDLLETKMDQIIQKIHKQTLQLDELKKLEVKTQSDLRNQTKQQELIQNLVLDLPSTNKVKKPIKIVDTDCLEYKICMERQKKVVLVPCGHTMCHICAKKLQKGECPTCRSKISDTQKFYL